MDAGAFGVDRCGCGNAGDGSESGPCRGAVVRGLQEPENTGKRFLHTPDYLTRVVKRKWFPLTSLYLNGRGKVYLGKWNLKPKRTVIFYNTLAIKEIQNKTVLQTP